MLRHYSWTLHVPADAVASVTELSSGHHFCFLSSFAPSHRSWGAGCVCCSLLDNLLAHISSTIGNRVCSTPLTAGPCLTTCAADGKADAIVIEVPVHGCQIRSAHHFCDVACAAVR